MSASSSELANTKSISTHHKVKAVLRLLGGESAEQLALEFGVSEERLLRWKHRFVEGGRAHLLQRQEDRSQRSHARRKKFLQWAALVAGLVVVIWVATRFLGSSAPGGE